MEIEKVGTLHVLTLPPGDMRFDFTTVRPEDIQEEALFELFRLTSEPRDVLLNFSMVTSINRYVLDLLKSGHAAITRAKKLLAFCAMHPSVEQYIRDSAPEIPFRIYSAEEAAIYYMTHR